MLRVNNYLESEKSLFRVHFFSVNPFIFRVNTVIQRQTQIDAKKRTQAESTHAIPHKIARLARYIMYSTIQYEYEWVYGYTGTVVLYSKNTSNLQ